jgi:UDP-N-acetylglucosamine:LPS N-acetylglucosamine transferase
VSKRPKVLAVASGGGHWVQMLRLEPMFAHYEVVFATVDPGYAFELADRKLLTINDATRWDKLGLIRLALRLLRIIVVERPDAVISTGAAPGFLAIRIGRLFGAKTIWLDSIANAERLSLSGMRAGRYADLWLTQWPHLARAGGPHYAGSVL